MLLSPSGWSRFGLLVSRGGCLPSIRGEKQIDIPSFGRSGGLVWRPQIEGRTSPFMGHFHRPGAGQESLPVSGVALAENCALPMTNVRFRKVSKLTGILDTFFLP